MYSDTGVHEVPLLFDGHDWNSSYYRSSLFVDSISFYDEQASQRDVSYSTKDNAETYTRDLEQDLQLPVDGGCYGEWQTKDVRFWSCQDCVFWVLHELADMDVGPHLTEFNIDDFCQVDGDTLKSFSVSDFENIFPDHGVELFYRLQKASARIVLTQRSKERETRASISQGEKTEIDKLEGTISQGEKTEIDKLEETKIGQIDESPRDKVVEFSSTPVKRKPGRPPRNGLRKKEKPEKIGRVWEFIRDLLLDPRYNPDVVRWEDRDEGVFRFVQSGRVARLWGEKKRNEGMDFGKFSRSIRHYYKDNVILPTKERLVYKFGPNASGWRQEPPVISQGQGHYTAAALPTSITMFTSSGVITDS